MSQQANAAAFRASGHRLDAYLSVYQPPTLCAGTLSATPTNPTTSLSITVTSGSAAAVLAGMEVAFYTSGNVYKGRTRVRFSGTIDATHLPVRELSQGTLDLASGDKFYVYEEIRLHDKLPTATNTFDPDGETYTSQNADPPPVVNSGGAYAGWAATAFVMTGSTSYTVDPDSGGAVTHLWTLPAGGSFTVGNSASASPTVQLAAGSGAIYHKVTDSSNSKYRTALVPTVLHDSTHLPYHVTVDTVQGERDNGYTYTVSLYDDATLEDFPDGSLVILWADEMINGTAQSFGAASPGRSHILCVGYLLKDTELGDADWQQIRFEVFDARARLAQITAYSKVMDNNAAPDAWTEIKTLGTKRAIIQLLMWYTTLIEAGFDLIFQSTYVDYTYPQLFLQRTTGLGMLVEMCNATDAEIVCDKSGRFQVQIKPWLSKLADRAAMTTLYSFADTDVISYSAQRPHWRIVEILKASGFAYGTDPQPLLSWYPGDAPGEGVDTPVAARLICADQDDLNDRTGLHGAFADKIFIDDDGSYYPAEQMTLRLRGSYHFADFYDYWIAFDSGALANLRNADYSTRRWWLKSTRAGFQGGTLVNEWVLQAETAAPAGSTQELPAVETPPWTPPPPIIFPTDPNRLLRGTNKIALFQNDSTLRKTSTFTRSAAQGGPIWSSIALTALTGWNGGDVLLSATQKAFFTDTAWIATDTRIYLLDSISAPTTVTAQHTFAASSSARYIQTERCHPTWAMCASFYSGTGQMKVAYTTDGSTWSEVSVGSTGSGSENGFVWMSGHTPGLARAATYYAPSGAIGVIHVFETTDYGASWSDTGIVISTVAIPPVRIEVPYADESVMYVCTAVHVGGGELQPRIFQVIGTTVTDVSPTYAGDTYGPGDLLSFRTWDTDARRMVLIGNHSNYETDTRGAVFVTRDGVGNLANIVVPAEDMDNSYENAWVGGDGLALYAGGLVGKIMYSDDFGLTAFNDRTGNGIGSGLTLMLTGWE